MSEDFKIASAFVEVNLRDNTTGDEQRIRASLENDAPIDLKTALRDPGNVTAVKKAIEASPAAKIRTEADIDKASVTKAKGDFEAAGSELGKSAARGYERATSDVDKATEKVAARTQAKFKAMQFIGAFAGLPAAAAVGAAGVGLALAAIPLMIAGVAVTVLGDNEQMAHSFNDLGEHAMSSVHDMAEVMQGPLVAAAERVRSGFDQAKPAIKEMFDEAGPQVLDFTDGVVGLALNAMPGFNSAIESADGPMRGLKSLLIQTGSGLDDFFTNATEGAEGAEHGLDSLGGIVEDFLGFAGRLFANLATGSSSVLPQFQSGLQQVENVVDTLTSDGMPALSGATGGFISTVSGALGIVNGLASGLGSWTAPIGAAGGQLLAISSLAKLAGTSLGETGFGLKAFATQLDEAGNKTSPFKQALADTEAGGSKLSRGLGAIASSGFNPLGLAIIAGGLLLSAYGESQQEAAKKAQQHKQAVNDLTSAIRTDNGVIGEAAQALIEKSLAEKNAKGNADALGVSYAVVTAAAQGSTSALQTFDGLVGNTLSKTVLAGTGGNKVMAASFGSVATEMVKTGESADKVIERYSTLTEAYNGMSEPQRNQILASLNLNQAVQQQVKLYEESVIATHQAEQATKQIPLASALATQGTSELAAAFNTVATSAGTASDKGSALVTILDRLAGRAPSFEESTQSINDQLRGFGEGFEKASKEAGHFDGSLINADGTINTVTANGSKLQDKLNSLAKASADSVGAFDELVKSGVPVGTALQQINGQANDTRDRFIASARALGFNATQAAKMADAYHLGSAAIGPMLAGLSDQDLAAAKVTKSVDALGNAVYTLPDGKTIKVDAETQNASAAVHEFVNKTEATMAETTVGANIDPATKNVLDWKNTTFQTRGDTTTYTNTNPATGAVTTWKVVTDATGARTTTATTTDPATGAVANWKRNADGTWARTNVDANMQPADRAARDWVPPNKNATLYYFAQVVNPPGGYNTSSQTGRAKANATGGILAFAGGGFAGLTPMRGGVAEIVPPDTQRIIGDNMKVNESYIPIDPASPRSQDILTQTMVAMGRDGEDQPTTINHYWNFVINAAERSDEQLASAVSSQVTWAMRGR